MAPTFQQGKAAYVNRTITVPSNNEPFVINANCTFFALFNVNGNIRISFDNEEATPVAGGIQIEAQNERVFKTITIYSDLGASVEFGYANGKIVDSRLTVTGTINFTAGQQIITYSGTSIAVGQRTNIGTSNSILSNLSATRNRITIKAFSTNTANIALGVNGGLTIANGHILEPGDAITLDTRSVIYVIGGAANQSASFITESN